ncbi:hypothetical protein B0H14DRAFT_2656107 [Mycena olivaceomarginata]|nr:hypothetical protein B0H14DRAFT_2656107 [Mycena olivaceomarginata]
MNPVGGGLNAENPGIKTVPPRARGGSGTLAQPRRRERGSEICRPAFGLRSQCGKSRHQDSAAAGARGLGDFGTSMNPVGGGLNAENPGIKTVPPRARGGSGTAAQPRRRERGSKRCGPKSRCEISTCGLVVARSAGAFNTRREGVLKIQMNILKFEMHRQLLHKTRGSIILDQDLPSNGQNFKALGRRNEYCLQPSERRAVGLSRGLARVDVEEGGK